MTASRDLDQNHPQNNQHPVCGEPLTKELLSQHAIEQQPDSIIELRRYFEEPNIERSIYPLDWWRNNANRFLRLHKIAAKYLCIPGSSVPSDRLFSKAGQLVSERRNRLKPENIDTILFLNHNMKLLSQHHNMSHSISLHCYSTSSCFHKLCSCIISNLFC